MEQDYQERKKTQRALAGLVRGGFAAFLPHARR